MKTHRVVTTVAALAAATALGVAAGSASYALWKDQEPGGSQIKTGSLSLSVAAQGVTPASATWDGTNTALTHQYTVSGASPFASLSPDNKVALPLQVHSNAVGRWGVDYTFGALTASASDPTLINATHATFAKVTSTAACTTSLATSGALYDGALKNFSVTGTNNGARGLLPTDDKTQDDFYCLVLSVAEQPSDPYSNTVTADGTVNGSGEDVSASGSWNANIDSVSDAARQGTLKLSLTAKRHVNGS